MPCDRTRAEPSQASLLIVLTLFRRRAELRSFVFDSRPPHRQALVNFIVNRGLVNLFGSDVAASNILLAEIDSLINSTILSLRILG